MQFSNHFNFFKTIFRYLKFLKLIKFFSLLNKNKNFVFENSIRDFFQKIKKKITGFADIFFYKSWTIKFFEIFRKDVI